MVVMLNESFTLKPSTNGAGTSQERSTRVEVTFRQARKGISNSMTRRVRAEGRIKFPNYPTCLDSEQQRCNFCHRIPSRHLNTERAFKRQRLLSHHHRGSSSSSHALHPTLSESSTSSTTAHAHYPLQNHRPPFPLIRRIPMELEPIPPSADEYWKQRCFRMQFLCHDTSCRMRDMQEDSRQLRRRVQELEKHLLLQTSLSASSQAAAAAVTTAPTGAAESEEAHHDDDIVESREGEDDPRQGVVVEQQAQQSQKRIQVSIESNCDRIQPPPFLSIPRNHQSTAAVACFYLTDGEGLSDSEFLEEDGDECEAEDLDIEVHDREGCW